MALALVCVLAAGGLAGALAGCGSTARRVAARTATTHEHEASDVLAASKRAGSLPLYVDPNNSAALQERAWFQLGDRHQARQIAAIAREPTAVWLTTTTGTVADASKVVTTAARAGAVAQLVLYDVPDRDCHGYSAGGAATPAQYLGWVGAVTAALGRRPVIVILEPDAIDQAASGGCLSPQDAQTRYRTMHSAVDELRRDPAARVYIDAGHPGWLTPSQVAAPLRAAGIAQASGFSVNVANFQTTAASIAYGRALSRMVGGAHFVIDTSRNGNGPPPDGGSTGSWCNPPGRRIGEDPTTHTGVPKLDALLWVKYPGQSDGDCGAGDPPAGAWWPAYAIALVGGRLPSNASAVDGTLSATPGG